MISPDDLSSLQYGIHRHRLLSDSLTKLEASWPVGFRWRWNPHEALESQIGDDWLWDFRDDCSEAIGAVSPDHLPQFVKLICDVTKQAMELASLRDPD